MVRKMSSALIFALGLGMSTAWADVSGDWNFAVDLGGMGSGNAKVSMQQAEDGTITGHYTGQLGNMDFTGKAEGDSFSFDLPGAQGTASYSGELQDDGTLKGKLDLAGMAEGDFVGTRQ